MRVHCIKHAHYEGLGSIEPWIAAHSSQVSVTETYHEPRFPRVDEFDCLIVMGGPMSANDDHLCPWLSPEKKLIAEAIESDKIVLGICMGAQLIASSLGAKVYPDTEPEIGWFQIELTDGGSSANALSGLPRSLEAFHWHGDTFDLPTAAIHLAHSQACKHQAFSVGKRVLGLQFHLEVTQENVRALTRNSRDHHAPGLYIQSEEEMLGSVERFAGINDAMATVLGNLWHQTDAG